MSGRATRLKGFDDDHVAAAARAETIRRVGLFRCLVVGRELFSCRGEEFSGFGDEGGAVSVGEHAVRANTMKSFWEDMQQEAADELVDIKGHGGVAAWPFDPVILPFEGDAAVVDSDQPSIGDGDAVGVTGEISQDLAGSGKRRLSILPMIRVLSSSSVIPIIRSMDNLPLFCTRNMAMGNAIFA